MTVTVAQSLAASLVRHGVRTVFGQSLPTQLMLAAEDAGIRQVLYRTENAGGVMADGYARVTNRIGVVGAQNGPAATLLVAPLAEALTASVPVVAFVQDVPASTRDRNAFQELDHFALFAGSTKWIRRLDEPTRAADYVDMAFTAAATGRPGPVVLLLPRDVMDMPAGEMPHPRRATLGAYPLDRPRPAADAVELATQLLTEAERPIIIAGGGVHTSQAHEALAELQSRARIPVATTPMGKGAVDERNPLSIGVVGNFMAAGAATHASRQFVTEADVVLLVGTRTNENGTDSWSLFSQDAQLIHIDIDGEELGRTYEAVRLVGDARAALTDLTTALASCDLSRRLETVDTAVARIAGARARYHRASSTHRESEAMPIRPERVIAELARASDEDAIVVADASYSSIWVANGLTSNGAGRRFLLPRGLAGLGWGLPLAIGAKAAEPDRQVICVVGDGGFGHVWSEVETAVREDLPVIVIVLNNGILGYQTHGENVLFGRHTSAVRFSPVDHAAIARACGADATTVSDPSRLHAAFEDALSSRRTNIIEVITDPNAYPPITSWQGDSGQVLRPAERMFAHQGPAS